jgi:hypothetical protein
MLKTIEGIYKDGQIELNELPSQISDSTQVQQNMFTLVVREHIFADLSSDGII